MDRLGLGYKALKKVKPDIIMVSASGFGASGPFKKYGGFATNFVAASGLSSIIGYAGGLPNEERGPADFRAGQFMALTVMVALLHRQRSGIGQQIDLSMTEAHVCGIGEQVMDYIINGRIAEPTGNQHEYMAPHNSYRCKGEDAWISIAIGNDKEWLALRQTMGDPDWAKDKKYSTALLRWKNQYELDKNIADWTVKFEPTYAMNLLQQAGVAAMPTSNSADILQDPHFKERNFIGEVTYKNEKQTVIGVPFIMDKTTTDIYKPAPGWGEHTDEILTNVLKLKENDIRNLKNNGVVK
jgi:benzylsuccinate CoA-transferase BbsF subunit